MADHCRPPCPLNERLVRSCTCVVKRTSIQNHTDGTTNHPAKDADCDVENVVDGENGNCNGNDEEYEDGDDDEEQDYNDQGANCHGNDDECNDAIDDVEKAMYDENANYHGNDKKFIDGTHNYDQELNQLELMNDIAE